MVWQKWLFNAPQTRLWQKLTPSPNAKTLSAIMKYLLEIESLIQNHRFEHFYLYNNLLKVIHQQDEINSKWKIGDNNSWILGFCANNNYSIYGLNYNRGLLNTVVEQFDFDILPDRIWLSGNKFIVDYLIDQNANIYFEKLKDRAFYKISLEDVKGNFQEANSSIKIRKANIQDLEILTKFTCDFFEEEYNGNNNKDYEEMKRQMRTHIQNGTYNVAIKNDEVIGFCSRKETVFENDMIGTVFVSKPNRQSKIGTALIKDMTKEILLDNKECWLMTDLSNIPSNKIMEGLNYKKIYEYTSGEVRKM